MKFTELNLKPQILKALKQLGYRELTPIQEETFPHIIAGKDMIALAETGSGKTAACGIPIVQSVDPAKNQVQALPGCSGDMQEGRVSAILLSSSC